MILSDYETILKNNFSFWSSLTQKEKLFIINNTTTVTYPKGTSLHSGKTGCIGVIFIKTGILRTYLLSDQLKEVTLYRLFENDTCIFSASCILKAITFDVFIEAEQDCEILLINISAFEKLAKENIYVELFSCKLALERFSDVMWSIQQILFMNLDKRLAIFLYDETVKQKSNSILITHNQIAKNIASAREAVTRMLKYFRDESVIEVSRGKILIKDKDKLKKMAN